MQMRQKLPECRPEWVSADQTYGFIFKCRHFVESSEDKIRFIFTFIAMGKRISYGPFLLNRVLRIYPLLFFLFALAWLFRPEEVGLQEFFAVLFIPLALMEPASFWHVPQIHPFTAQKSIRPSAVARWSDFSELYGTRVPRRSIGSRSARLALGLRVRGVPAQWVPRLSYEKVGANLTIDVNHPGHPTFHVDAPIVEPGPGTIPFHANWWIQKGPFRTKMSTPIPAIQFGGATATLTTPRRGQLGRLLESSTETFALLDSFNRFPTAPMTVSVSRP